MAQLAKKLRLTDYFSLGWGTMVHGAPSECEIVCGAEFAGEGGQEVAMR